VKPEGDVASLASDFILLTRCLIVEFLVGGSIEAPGPKPGDVGRPVKAKTSHNSLSDLAN
jgi:hypothetical protein